MKAVNLKTSGKREPLNLEQSQIYFQWQIEADHNHAAQSAYDICLEKDGNIIWESGKRKSGQSLYVKYDGPVLSENTDYQWKVKLWDENGQEGFWSEKVSFGIGLPENFGNAEWIGMDDRGVEPFDSNKVFYCADDFVKGENEYYLPPTACLRKEIKIGNAVKSARLHVSALGLAEFYINGKKAGNQWLLPGISDYPKRVYYFTFSVGEMLQEGENVLSCILADGWYAGYMGLNNREWYGHKPRMILHLEVEYIDGSVETFISDETWKTSTGKIREADIFQGEVWDANREQEGWMLAGFCDDSWENVDCGAEYGVQLMRSPGTPVVEHGRIRPRIETRSDNCLRLIFEKYVCGILKLKVQGEKGSSVRIRYAEMLNEEDELWLRGNRSARCQDMYYLRGDGEEIFQPLFTYHGFRCAEIYAEGNVKILEAEGIQLGTELTEATEFSCSNEVVNHVFEMVKATEKANLFEVPTDCCARDERLGWGMEGNHFLKAMTWMNNLSGMIEKWLYDIFDGQREDGGLEAIAPPVVMKDIEQFIGDLQSYHGVMMVHTIYRMYGNLDVVRKFYEPLEKYFEFVEKNSDRYLRVATSCDWLGIWESTNRSDTDHGYGECTPTIVGTAHYGMAVKMMEELSEALGCQDRSNYYKDLYENIKDAFRKNYVRRDGTLRQGKQAEYLLGLAAGFFPDEKKVMDILEEKLLEKGYIRWTGGTPATPYFLGTLKKYGRCDLANQFLCSEKYPSIGYMWKKGFDTIWERWDAVDEEGKIHPQVMNAICHAGFAVVGQYLIEGLAGIESIKAGFETIRIAPGVSKEITACKTKYQSIYGEISVDWKWENDKFDISVNIPAGRSATVELPIDREGEFSVLSGETTEINRTENKVIFEIKSGHYAFATEWKMSEAQKK